jgi:hypothetical protein
MAMVEREGRFTGSAQPEELLRTAEERCLEAEQRCFRAERRRFEAERRREQLEVLLAKARETGVKMEQTVSELKRLVAFLRVAADRPEHAADADAAKPVGTGAPDDSREQMADALSEAIARLRANVQAVGSVPPPPPRAHASSSPPPLSRPAHKHSRSWIARWRIRRKQRRS